MKAVIKMLMCALCLSALLLCSCGGNGDSALEFRDEKGKTVSSLSTGFVSLWIGVEKNTVSDYLQIVEDTDGWNTVLDEESGKTFSDMFKDDCVATLKNLLSVEYLHDYVYGISFSDEQQKSVEKEIDSIAQSLGSFKNFEHELEKYGCSAEDYERYLTLMLKQSTLFNSLYSEKGFCPITEEQKKEYFTENYAVVNHIYFDMRGTSKDDGTLVSLTEDEKQVIRDRASKLYEEIATGEISYEDALIANTQDGFAASHPYGYFVADDGTYFDSFVKAAFSLEDGEITLVETTSGMHILRREKMVEEYYAYDETVYTAISEKLIKNDFNSKIQAVRDGVYVNEKALEGIDASLVRTFEGF